MKSLSLEEENLNKDIRNLFRLEKKLKELKIEYLDIKNLFEHEEENYYKPSRVGNLL